MNTPFKNKKITPLVITNLLQYVYYGGSFNDWVEVRIESYNITQSDIKEIKTYIKQTYDLDVDSMDKHKMDMVESVKSIFSTAKGAYNNVLKGKSNKVGDDIVEERMEICKACPYFNKKRNQCGKCSCFLKFKTRLESSKCPINKW